MPRRVQREWNLELGADGNREVGSQLDQLCTEGEAFDLKRVDEDGHGNGLAPKEPERLRPARPSDDQSRTAKRRSARLRAQSQAGSKREGDNSPDPSRGMPRQGDAASESHWGHRSGDLLAVRRWHKTRLLPCGSWQHGQLLDDLHFLGAQVFLTDTHLGFDLVMTEVARSTAHQLGQLEIGMTKLVLG